MVKLSIVTSWPEVLWWSYMVFKVSRWLTNVFIITIYPVTLKPVYDPLFCWLGLYLLVTLGGLWWSDQLSGEHQSHIVCKCPIPLKQRRKATITTKLVSALPLAQNLTLWFHDHQGLSDSYKTCCKQYGIDVHLKGGQTIKDHLMSPKDKDPINKKIGESATGLTLTGVDCVEGYIPKSARNSEDHIWPSQHLWSWCHNWQLYHTGGERTKTCLRTIKEALFIRANNPSLNRNIGKYHLPHIWDEVLLNIS